MIEQSAGDDLMKGKAARVDSKQHHPMTGVGPRNYFTLRCEMEDNRFRDILLTGVENKVYSESRLEQDFDRGNSCFKIRFSGTDIRHSFT